MWLMKDQNHRLSAMMMKQIVRFILEALGRAIDGFSSQVASDCDLSDLGFNLGDRQLLLGDGLPFAER